MQFVEGQIVYRNRWSRIMAATVIKVSPKQLVIKDLKDGHSIGSTWTLREADFKTLHHTKSGALIEQMQFCESEIKRHQEAIAENGSKILKLQELIEAEL